jgi:hypothetical protein
LLFSWFLRLHPVPKLIASRQRILNFGSSPSAHSRPTR